MRAWKRILGLGALAAFPAVATAADEIEWIADYDQAAQVAEKQGKNLLVDFTGSDWCGWCVKLHNEVFAKEEFLNAAKKDFVLVALDFPRSEEAKAKVPNARRNDELAKKYEVQGFPTILLMTPSGEVFGRTGYQPGGAEKYVAHLNDLRESGLRDLAEVKRLVDAWNAASGPEKDAAWEAAVAKLERMEPDSASVGKLAEVVATAMKDPAAPKEKQIRAAKALFGVHQADAALQEKARALDPENEHGLLEKAVAARAGSVQSEEDLARIVGEIDALDAFGIRDRQLALELYANAAFWNDKFLKDEEKAKAYAQKAKDIGIEIGTDNERLLEMLDAILEG
jgi:thioredoxin-related protein